MMGQKYHEVTSYNKKHFKVTENTKICFLQLRECEKDSNAAFIRDFKARTLKWLFPSILILGKGVRTFLTGGLKLTTVITV